MSSLLLYLIVNFMYSVHKIIYSELGHNFGSSSIFGSSLKCSERPFQSPTVDEGFAASANFAPSPGGRLSNCLPLCSDQSFHSAILDLSSFFYVTNWFTFFSEKVTQVRVWARSLTEPGSWAGLSSSLDCSSLYTAPLPGPFATLFRVIVAVGTLMLLKRDSALIRCRRRVLGRIDFCSHLLRRQDEPKVSLPRQP